MRKYITLLALLFIIPACKDATAPECGINGECHNMLAGSWSGGTNFVDLDFTVSNVSYSCTTGFMGGNNCTTTGSVSGTARGVAGERSLRGALHGSSDSFALFLSVEPSVEAAVGGCAPSTYNIYISTVSAKRLSADIESYCAGGIIVRHESVTLNKR